ncbi:MAG: IS66 family insertion sequence element accessory protein TnpB [Bacteroidota bacterium]
MGNNIEHRKEMFRLMEEWKASGKSKKQFCEEHTIAQHRFFYWQKRYNEQNDPQGQSFVPVKTGKKNESISSYIEIHYPNGVRLHLPSGTGLNIIRTMIGIM